MLIHCHKSHILSRGLPIHWIVNSDESNKAYLHVHLTFQGNIVISRVIKGPSTLSNALLQSVNGVFMQVFSRPSSSECQYRTDTICGDCDTELTDHSLPDWPLCERHNSLSARIHVTHNNDTGRQLTTRIPPSLHIDSSPSLCFYW